MYKSIICFMLSVLLVSIGCSSTLPATSTPTAVPTPTPEQLKLINGEFDACLLFSSTEVENISGIKVSSEIISITGTTACRYIAASDSQVILLTSVTTDAALKKANKSYSAVEWYKMQKMVHMDMADIFKIQEIDNFGDQAYLREGTFIDINVLKNSIVYLFSSRTPDDKGIGYDALMKLATIALQRVP